MPPVDATSQTQAFDAADGVVAALGPGQRVQVLLPLPLAGAFDYRLPVDIACEIGAFVTVPLGARQVSGVIWGPSTDAALDEAKIKDVIALLPIPPLPAANRAFVDWVSGYYLSPPGAVLRMAMSAPGALAPPRVRIAYTAAETAPEIKMTGARRRVIAAAQDGFARSAGELAEAAGVSASVVKKLAELGGLATVQIPDEARFAPPDPAAETPRLSSAQTEAATILRGLVAARRFDAALLDGVTGAGKTEVYYEAIAEALAEGRQVLVLVPEIALSVQWLDRFERRFGAAPAEWHSDLTQGARRRTWRAVAEGKARIVVGARSALHLPFPDLGLIVVDEEHESAFKQDDGVHYHARDMAVVRARLAECPVILVSATPSLETVVNAQEGKYKSVHLPERHAGAELPAVQIVDVTKDKPGRQQWLSPTLRRALEETLEAGDQAMLFLNRRGYAPLTLCRTCGHRLNCPNCAAWLVEHRFTKRLQCHHCGYNARMPAACPECGDEESFAACGPGVERLYEEAAAFLPEARIELVTSDTIHSPADAAAFVARMAEGETDLVIGTQIVAKGYHFPNLTLVGVVDADLGLKGGDLRAAERSYQLLHQVGGRAGRAGKPGLVILQTAEPDAPVFQALAQHDRDGFLEAEIAARRAFAFPPVGRLAGIIVSSVDEAAADHAAKALARAAPHADGVAVLGPAPAPLSLLRGRFRRRLLLKTRKSVRIQKVIADWFGRVDLSGKVRLELDIDPYSFM
ncbi:MAG: primosomal protein N' [Alphaproteobacteria bacterium]|nr:primosomal protein N' [Alphaproteobacteria bacterium]